MTAATPTDPVPDRVRAALERAEQAGFEMSSDPRVGRLLATFAAATPAGGRVLELGTGVGHGLAWIVEGLGTRDDVDVVTVDVDPDVQSVARDGPWPAYVRFVVDDGANAVHDPGGFDLIFPDAPGGKLTNLDGTVRALRPGGVLLVDDMDLDLHTEPFVLDDGTTIDLRRALRDVRDRLLDDPGLMSVELDVGTGVIVAVKRR